MTHYAETREIVSGHEQRLFAFPNGYGASVVRGQYTYGGSNGLFELAVLGPDGDLDYTTPITGDVIGWLDEEEVQMLLDRIAVLPRKEEK